MEFSETSRLEKITGRKVGACTEEIINYHYYVLLLLGMEMETGINCEIRNTANLPTTKKENLETPHLP